MALLVEKHARYFGLCLLSFPARAQSEDSNKLSLVYFCLQGLELLGRPVLAQQADIDFIYRHVIPLADPDMQAFRASDTFALDPERNRYDLPNLLATYFALAALLALKDNYAARLDRHKVMAFVARLQTADGSFMPVLGPDGDPFGESDLRLCYVAALVRKMVGYDKLPPAERTNDIDVDALKQFIRSKLNYNGGLASHSGAESHAGLTFCGLAALKLVGDTFAENDPWTQLTLQWLVHRQVDYTLGRYGEYEYYEEEDVGGFNGRENKLADTCYAWWVGALLALLSPKFAGLIDSTKAAAYLLERCQQPLVGGFGKDAASPPDPFHSFLGLAALLLLAQNSPGGEALEPVDVELVISQRLRDFMESLW